MKKLTPKESINQRRLPLILPFSSLNQPTHLEKSYIFKILPLTICNKYTIFPLYKTNIHFFSETINTFIGNDLSNFIGKAYLTNYVCPLP